MIVLVDSNILVYAINRASPKHKAAQAFLQDWSGRMAIAHQNIFETLRVLTHPKFVSPMAPAAAIESVRRIAVVAQLVAPDYKTAAVAEALILKHQLGGNRVFDAYLAATALTAGLTTVATDNTKDFKVFEQIKLINPF